MEATAVSSTHHASPDSTSPKSGVDEISTTPPTNQAVATSRECISKEKNISSVVSEDHGSIPLNIGTSHNVDIKTSSSVSRSSGNAKPVRLKASDKLTRAIEACKKLHNISDQKQDIAGISNVCSGGAESAEPLNGVTSRTDTSEPVSEVCVNLPRSSEENLYLMSDNAENDSSSSSLNSTNSKQSANEDSSTPSSQKALGDDAKLVKKRFLFLFRPSDHEVLFQNKGINSFRCKVCLGIYRQKFSLKRHFLRTHINFKYISKSDISNCKIAVPNEFIGQDSGLDYKTPHGSKYRKKFKSSNAVFMENNETRLMPGLYICHICVGVKFDLETELQQHYNSHSEAERKKFKCDKCGASFYKKQILSRHLASHGERVVRKSCKKCGIHFPTVEEFEAHMKSHSNGKACKYCSKVLSTCANKKRHEALHLGLKPYSCAHCGMNFAQSKDLDRHLKKQHCQLCHLCVACDKVFTSRATLDVHNHEKHSGISPKKAKAPSPEPGNKLNVANPQLASVPPPVRSQICFVCKRSFPTFYAMMKHRRQAHDYTKRRRNRKTMKQKLEQAQQAAAKDKGAKVRKPYGRPPKQNNNFPTSTVRRGRPPLDRSVKFGAPYDRNGTRFLTKRDKELAKKKESEFYCNLSENIAANLLLNLDGQIQDLSLKEDDSSDDQSPPCNYEERGRLPWSNYNFPHGYDVDHALNTRGRVVNNKCRDEVNNTCRDEVNNKCRDEARNRWPENLSNRDKCLYATGLNRVQKLPQTTKNADNDKQVGPANDISETARTGESSGIGTKKLDLEERKKMIGHKVPVAYVCYVCKEIFESNETFKVHCVNNHPNVDCSCIEIEGNKNTPPMIPGNLCKQNVSPVGELFSSNVPPPLSYTGPLKCTKCKYGFDTYLQLHSHIIECGGLKSLPRHVWKGNTQKRIKRTMKSRMSLARQRAAVNAYGRKFKTPEKQTFNRSDTLGKSIEKISKSAEKSQFYKSGRLQTTSFTADMNYFKTKPVKPPANTQSKRGRKSYASLSYRYRNASMQSSVSECPHCKEPFPSQSALNIHIQHHCMYSAAKQNDKSHFITDLTSRVAKLPSVNNVSTAGSVFPGCDKSRNILDGNSLKNSCGKTPFPQFVNANALLLASDVSCDYAKEAKKNPLVSKLDERGAVVDLQNSDAPNIPIDLSKQSDAEACVTVDPSNEKRGVISSGRSALEMSLKAVHDYIQNSEQNEHISDLEEPVENVTTSSPVTSSPVQKPVTAKKVGRPKKVKRQSPYYLKKNSSLVKNVERTNSPTISKLEETVKRLTESKFKTDVQKEQNTSTFKTIEAAKNSTEAERTNVPTTINVVQPILRTPGKIGGKDASKSPSTAAFATSTSITLSVANNFVPLIIYGDQSKSNNALLLTSVSPNKGKSPRSQNSVHASSPMKTSHASDNHLSPENTSKNACGVNSPLDASNADSPDKKSSEKTRLSSGSQGRISPSLESIVNSIKQKLHSQEQESPPQDDVAISWLEDEKFEIPSGPRLVLPTNSSSNSPLSVDNEPFRPISEDTSLDQEKSGSIETLKSPPESTLKLVSRKTAFDDTCEKNEFASSVSRKIESLLVGSISSPKFEAKMKIDNKPANFSAVPATAVQDAEVLNIGKTPTNDIATLQSIPNEVYIAQSDPKDLKNPFVEELARKKVKNFTPVSKKTYISKECNPQNQNLIRKKPGRPKKNTVELNIDASVSEYAKCVKTSDFNPSETDLKDEVSVSNLVICTPSVEDTVSAEIGTELNVQDVDKGSIISEESKIDQEDVLKSGLPLIRQDLSNIVYQEYEDFRDRPSCSSTPDTVSTLFEDNSALSKMSTLRAFRTKSKQNQSADSEIIPAIEPKITTEFGKNLASRMKEKMRLSFEIAATENVVRSEECTNSDGVPDTSDVNSLMSDDESEFLEIKKEIDCLEPSKKHSCPFCMLEFAYLTNFRRHLRLCRARLETKEIEPVPSTSTTVLQYLPKKDEVEHSMLNLLRHQSRQTQMLKEAEKSNGDKVESKFRTYSCIFCHRIYLSLFKLLQHQLTHKLENDSFGASPELEDAKDMTDIDKYSVNELDEGGMHGAEINTYIDPMGAKLMIADKPIEMLSSLNGETELKADSSISGEIKVIDDEVKKKHISDVIEDVVKANNESEDIQSDAIENLDSTTVSIKTEELLPLKRKRGRPFGWRKDTSVTHDNLTGKVSRNNFNCVNKAKTVRFGIKRKTGKLLPGPIKRGCNKFFSERMGVKTGNLFTNGMKDNSISQKPFEFTADDEQSTKIVPYDETVATKPEVSDIPMFQNSSLKNKKKQKKIIKHNLVKEKSNSNTTLDGIENATPAISLKSEQKIKTEPKGSSPIFQSKSLSPTAVKRHKSRSIVSMKGGPVAVKSELPLKRRPGRPSKALQSPTPSTSSQNQPGSARRLGRMMSKAVTVDSSDSEYDVPEKKDAISKKRFFRICAICKGKFSASLALFRHIQLVHSRHSKPVELKTEMPSTPKALKRILPISPVSSSNSYESKDAKQSSQTAVDKEGDEITEPPKMSSASSVDVVDTDTVNTKVLKKNAKSPSSVTVVKPKRLTKSPKLTANVSDDDFQAHAKVFKEGISRSARVTSPKVVKKLNAKSAANDNSGVDSTKVMKKGVATSPSIRSEASSSKVVGKLSDKSTADGNFGADSTNFKKGISNVLSIISGACSPKGVKQRAAKSISANSSDSNSPKVVKKCPPKFVTADNSDAESTKSFKKVVSKPAVTDIDVIKPNFFKKRTAKSAGDCNSDTDSAKSFRKGLSKALSVNLHAHSPKAVPKPAAKAVAGDISDADSTQSFRRGVSKLLSIDSNTNSPKAIKLATKTAADANSTKSTKKIVARPVTVYNSDSESAKNLRKAIPKSRTLDNSDVDSDFSVKTDVTPSRSSRVCPICKEKFSAKFLQQHIQLVHSRRTTTGTVKNTSVEKIMDNSPKIQSPSVRNRQAQSPSMKIEKYKSRSMKIGKAQSQSAKIKKIQSSAMKNKRVQSPSMRMKKIQSATKIQKMIDAASRSALSRQCRKPLPRLKRKWSKKDNPSQE